MCVVAQERLPALRRRPLLRTYTWQRWSPRHRSRTQQFAMNARRTPNGLAMLISRINCRTSFGTAGRPRPRLDFQRQNNRKPARCHEPGSGQTMASAPWAFGNRRQTQPRIKLSTAKNDIPFGLPRRKTMICCLRIRISASSAARDRNRSTTNPQEDQPA